jgi:hypothetical protein
MYRQVRNEIVKMEKMVMKSQSVKLTKKEAIAIAYRALIERIVERPGIWTHLNARIRHRQLEAVGK